MAIQLKQIAAVADEKILSSATHLLIVLPETTPANKDKASNKLATIPFYAALEAKLKRNRSKLSDLAKTPITADLANGSMPLG